LKANVKAHLPPGGAYDDYLAEANYFHKIAAVRRRRRSHAAGVRYRLAAIQGDYRRSDGNEDDQLPESRRH